MKAAEENLCRVWDALNSAIKRVAVSQPHAMTAAAEELEARRKEMERAVLQLLAPRM